MQQLYEIQISMSVSEVLLQQSHVHLFTEINVCGFSYTVMSE